MPNIASLISGAVSVLLRARLIAPVFCGISIRVKHLRWHQRAAERLLAAVSTLIRGSNARHERSGTGIERLPSASFRAFGSRRYLHFACAEGVGVTAVPEDHFPKSIGKTIAFAAFARFV
ncbi:hypothetical protein [Azospirillum oryzae]|uniref:hypothetical protein n=1 Tax=Azospirillum oryzae TaxID=286727 RepID=UPI0011778256|nr:hypothetical protein [Azospirillum oryzae]